MRLYVKLLVPVAGAFAVLATTTGRGMTAAAVVPAIRALDFSPTAISADGTVIVGSRPAGPTQEAVRWTADGGTIGLLPGYEWSHASGVSADGSVVVGTLADGVTQPFRWAADVGVTRLGRLPGYDGSGASGVSADGNVVVGTATVRRDTYPFYDSEPFRWTPGSGMVGLGRPLGDEGYSGASAVSADGSVVVGTEGESLHALPPAIGTTRVSQPFRWTADGGRVGLGVVEEDGDMGGGHGSATGVSADGNVVVGHSSEFYGGGFLHPMQAFRWTANGGMAALGHLPGHTDSSATAVSADGEVVVGVSTWQLPPTEEGENPDYGRTLFIWDQFNGMRSLSDVLTDSGVDMSGWDLGAEPFNPTAISADGLTIIGWGTNSSGPTGWVATIPEPAFMSPLGAAVLLLGRRRRARHTTGAATARNGGRSVTPLVAGATISALLALPLSARAAPFDLLATHPDAAVQPTALGQTLQTLKPFNGKLYAGFGDYNTNTGPIGVRAFDPAAGAFTPRLLHAETEALLIYRTIGGKLYAPHIDPWPSPPPTVEFGGYSLGVADGTTETWRDFRPVEGIHMFDVASYDGADLWIAGSRATATGSEGVAWRSRDGGDNWEVALVVPPQRSGALNARLYAIHAYNGRLYTQGHDSNLGPHSTSKVFDGTTWSDGPSLGGGFTGNMWHPETFAGEMVYDRVHGGSAGRISKFNGTRTAIAWTNSTDTFYDYTIDDGVLYALITDGRIFRTSDLVSWTLLDTAPTTSRSLAVLGDKLYVGGTGGQLFSYSVPVPEPAAALFVVAAALLVSRRRRAAGAATARWR